MYICCLTFHAASEHLDKLSHAIAHSTSVVAAFASGAVFGSGEHTPEDVHARGQLWPKPSRRSLVGFARAIGDGSLVRD